MNSTPLVSIVTITFNHESYIAQAIEGVLIQKTKFPIELVIGEDCSTDKTREICIAYQQKHPDIIRLLLNERNIGMMPNFIQTLQACRGKYIALCEGDDFWTDPFKLQKQVDFLEKNPKFVLSSHDAFIVDSENKLVSKSKLPLEKQRDYEAEELIQGQFILTLSICFRNLIKDFPKEMLTVLNGDTFLISILGKYGAAHFHNDIAPAGYRLHNGGVWGKKDEAYKLEKRRNTILNIFIFHKREAINKTLYQPIFIKYIKISKELMKIRKKSKLHVLNIYIKTLIQCIKNSYIREVFHLSKETFKILFK